MFNYVQLDEQGYCIGISTLNGEVKADNMVLLEEYNESYIGRKYNLVLKEWTDEYFTPELEGKPISEHETLTKEVYDITQFASEDNLLNMDLICSIEEKLTRIMEHLGIEY